LGENKGYQFPKELYIGPYTLIGQNVVFGERVIVDAYCSIDADVVIGKDTLVTYRSSIGFSSDIGNNCVIGGFIPENCIIGDNCRVFGKLVHTHSDTTLSWDHHEVPEKSPIIHEMSFVGFDAVISGGVEVGPHSFVCAGAIITRNVDPYCIAFGTNQITHFTNWRGQLKNNPVFRK